MERSGHPYPPNQGCKMARFSLRATSSLIFFWGGGADRGVSGPCYSVGDWYVTVSTERRSDESNLKKLILWLRPKARSKLLDSTEECTMNNLIGSSHKYYSVLIQ